MLFSPEMRSAVLQATAIGILAMLYDHHVTVYMCDEFMENEGFKNIMSMVNATLSQPSTNGIQSGHGRLALDAGKDINGTLPLKQTAGPSNGTTTANEPMESYYGRTFPREVVVYFVISVLQYWWFIGLEKLLPARPRYRETPYDRKVQIEESEDREEEVVKRWIAQGRVRRASLSWCNIFLKWVLDMTVGVLCFQTIGYLLQEFLKFKSPTKVFGGLQSYLLFNSFGVYFSITPLARLTAFVVIPAHRQLVFTEAMELIVTIFFHVVIRAFANWVVKTQYAQDFMRNVTREMENDPQRFGLDAGEL
ncbi:hypothetical protein DDE82_006309 [Stemphylium lycopersici]|nr:integral membrane mpv17 pmp22 family [Stemphylium lycopersici]RAR01695.1 hypothetical protein DDE82_006309 [Stemphylium lycopersici]